MQSDFEDFLDLFIHYMCSRCRIGAGTETPQDTTDGSGRHAHNGEILAWIKPVEPNSLRILSAYAAYCHAGRTRQLQYIFANAYNRPSLKTLRHTPETVAAQRILDHKSETWIRHGIERPKYMDYTNPQLMYPPKDTRYDIGDSVRKHTDENRYAIDLDRWPFTTCSEHKLDQQTGAPWAFTAGYLPISVFKKLQGTLHTAADRDHLYASSNIPAIEFTYIIWDFGTRVNQLHEQRAAQEQLLHNGLPTIHIRTTRKLYELTTLLQCYADALKP